MKTLLTLFLAIGIFSCHSDSKSKFSVPVSGEELSGNEKVLNSLKSNGDSLIKPRKVDHWIYFKNESDKNCFIEAIKPYNFAIEEENFDKNLGDTPYILHISRTDKVDLENADKFTSLIESKAKQCNGDYDGWETSIEE